MSDSPSSQGDNQAYHEESLAAHAMTAKEDSFHMTSVSKVSMFSSGASTGSEVPSWWYFVHPLRLTHRLGFGGAFA